MTIRVGIIGANPDKGWGSAVHIPVLAALPGYQLAAVGTTREETASRSAAAFGAPYAFSEPNELIACPDVDLVTITVKAPDHHALVLQAVEAGKHVYCEWPLAATTVQAAEMFELAAHHGVCAMVGLQARGAGPLRRAKALVEQGRIGKLVSVHMHCALPGGGRRRSREGLYVIDKSNGASTLAIQGGHALDALRFVAGEFAQVAAVVANHFDEVEVVETGERFAKTAPDQVLVSGLLHNGAVVSATINGGVVNSHGVTLELFGEDGSITLRSRGKSNIQMSELELQIGYEGEPMQQLTKASKPVAAKARQPYPGVDVPSTTLDNVATLYLDLERAIERGTTPHPDFAVGLSLHQLLDAIVQASESGTIVRTGVA